MKVFGHEVKTKTVAITVAVGAGLALLVALLRKSGGAASAPSADNNALDVQDDTALGTSAPVAGGVGGATSGIDPSLLGPLLSFEEQSQQNSLLAGIQAAQIAAAQQVQSLQAQLNAKVQSKAITAQQSEAQISANTQRTDTAISVGIPALAGILTKIFGGSGSAPAPNVPSAPGAPGFSGGAPAGGPVFAEESLGNIASFGAFNLI